MLPAKAELKPGAGGGEVGRSVPSGKLEKSLLPPEPISSRPHPYPLPFVFSLTLVTDDKASFPAKPINKLNRQKMSI